MLSILSGLMTMLIIWFVGFSLKLVASLMSKQDKPKYKPRKAHYRETKRSIDL